MMFSKTERKLVDSDDLCVVFKACDTVMICACVVFKACDTFCLIAALLPESCAASVSALSISSGRVLAVALSSDWSPLLC